MAIEAEKIKKLEEKNNQNNLTRVELEQESESEKQQRDEELEQQAHMERLRLETLRKLNEEHGRKLKLFVAETRSMPKSDSSKHKIEEVSSEARRQSMAVNEAEKNIKTEKRKGLEETFTKISKLESSIADLDWELERFEIEKMKGRFQEKKGKG